MKKSLSYLMSAILITSSVLAVNVVTAEAAVKRSKKQSVSIVKGTKKKKAAVRGRPKKALPASAPLVNRGSPPPSCPSAGRIGIFTGAELASTIRANLNREIEICADLLLREADMQVIDSGFTGLAPNQPGFGFRGRLNGLGHTLSVEQAAEPRLQSGIWLGLSSMENVIIENMTLRVPGAGVGADREALAIIGGTARNSQFRNIVLENVTSSVAGLVNDASDSRFDNIRGSIKVRVTSGPRYAGAMARLCQNCAFTGLNLGIDYEATASFLALPPNRRTLTYAGGLVGYADWGYIHVRQSLIRGAVRYGFMRSMIVAAHDGDASFADPMPAIPPKLVVEDTRLIDIDLTPADDGENYQVGAIAARSNLTELNRVLLRRATLSADGSAGGLVGIAGSVVGREIAIEDTSVEAGERAGGMFGMLFWPSEIEDSYFRGAAAQHDRVSQSPGASLSAAAGIVAGGNRELALHRVYVNAAVTSPNRAFALLDDTVEPAGAGPVVQNTYYNGDLAMSAGLGTPLTTAEMRLASSYVGFSPTTWVLTDGQLPRLRSNPAYTVQDLFDFINDFFAASLRADLNGDGTISIDDLFAFLTVFQS